MNKLIREAQKATRTYGYETARLMGVSISTYTRKMRSEMPLPEQQRIAQLIYSYRGASESPVEDPEE